jgi:hypothetical protein
LIRGIPIYVFWRLEAEGDTLKFYRAADTNAAAIAEREKLQHTTYEPSAFVELTVFTMPTTVAQTNDHKKSSRRLSQS